MSLKSPFTQPVMPSLSDMGGQLPTSRGTDPNISLSGASGITASPFSQAIAAPSGQETPNSVSGLPAAPQRYQPSETPPAPPTLTERNPGTIA